MITARSNTKLKNSELVQEFFYEGEEGFIEKVISFNELMMRYGSAVREVKTKFEILNDELSLTRDASPIETIQSRIKKPLSIAKKLKKLGKPATIAAIEENLNDVAGVRVICSFINDIYKIAEMFSRQDDITIIEIKDYIKNPKPNGYRSYHMIIEVPVFFSDGKCPMRVEIQIRTVAMDFWASLEHQIRYKKDGTDLKDIIEDLKECADIIAHTDTRMLEIKKRIESRV